MRALVALLWVTRPRKRRETNLGPVRTFSINDVKIVDGTVSALTSHLGNLYSTTATVPRGLRVHIGYALPAPSNIESVQLNGALAAYESRNTHRGREVIVTTNSGQTLHLVIIAQQPPQ